MNHERPPHTPTDLPPGNQIKAAPAQGHSCRNCKPLSGGHSGFGLAVLDTPQKDIKTIRFHGPHFELCLSGSKEGLELPLRELQDILDTYLRFRFARPIFTTPQHHERKKTHHQTNR